MNVWLEVIRVKQWYKNLVIFLPLLFVGKFFDFNLLMLTIIGFFALCLVSSVNYITNDIADIKKDRENHEKVARPLASGKIKVWQATAMAIFLLGASFAIGAKLSYKFLSIQLALFAVGQIYNIFLRKEEFADILTIASSFVLRAVSGTFIIGSDISPWLVICTFLLSLFLSIGKRHGELIMLRENADAHRPALKFYTKEVTGALMIVATTTLIMSYSFYSFLSNRNLLFTLPISLYAVFRYFHLAYSGSEIARKPENMHKDWKLFASVFIWVLTIFAILYLR
ncbi:MAG: UbiA prenyltransferase family protein [DPANN group archaeon]|nr:UbiA prenyltransferase family protein [DPANN group archaeon]